MDKLVVRREPLAKGEFLYRAGEKFKGIYAIQDGAVKTYGLTVDGREQVTGFHISGEVFGLDAIDGEVHPCNAVALEKTEVCQIPFAKLEELSMEVPELLHNLSRIMSREIMREQHVLLMLGGTSAEQRIARFLLNMSQRYADQKLVSDRFRLCMSRQDISNYLGLALETVSRQFSQFQERGLIDIQNRYVQIKQFSLLKQVAQ